MERLTPREAEVLRAMVDAETAAEAARSLFVATNTVRTHLAEVYSKLDVHSLHRALIVSGTVHRDDCEGGK